MNEEYDLEVLIKLFESLEEEQQGIILAAMKAASSEKPH